MSERTKQDAKRLLMEADKKRQPSVMSKFFGNGSSSLEEAADMYVSAANKFKACKELLDAAKAFDKAADCHKQRSEGMHDAATQLVNASQMYRKADPADINAAIARLNEAVQLYVELGRFHIAAKHEKEIAEIHESLGDLKSAVQAYEQAGEWFDGEDAKSNATNCKLKVAQFSAQLEDYKKACEIFEKVGLASVDNTLTRWSVKDYFFKAGLCYLANGDVIGAQNAMTRFHSTDATFEGTREAQFLKNLIEATDQNDIDTFTNLVVEYDSFKKLDNWTTTILLRIKRGLKESESLA